ncbi:hypothetical protein LTR37_009251 [Vermiconidia calcicola]|uniref:Uncharacterized protein n=1 Tax=Vermiconidia calcicola TaxID=1690605 RepID=A0ACC3N8Y2_9PEZI|nr:hypothetical protein LTR37_009251 [Vermiconidia calcicola]
MKAIKVSANGKAGIQEVSLPELRDGCVLVKVSCVAVNPIDWVNLDFQAIPGSTLGCDFSGTVAEIGPKVNKTFDKGERVCGWVVGNNKAQKDEGGFAEYCVASVDLLMRVPESMSDEEAASPPAGVATAGMGLFQKHGMVLPDQAEDGKGEPVLVYGGTSATATLAIQYAKLAGYEAITTCSPRSFGHVKSLGASAAFDYNDPECAAKIRDYTADKLTKVLDCISKDDSPRICADAISSKGGTISCTLPYPEDIGRKDVEVKMIFTLGIGGKDSGYGDQVIPGNPDDFEFGARMYAVAERLFREGKVSVHPPKVSSDGLEGVLGGLEAVKNGKASGVKLVYKL